MLNKRSGKTVGEKFEGKKNKETFYVLHKFSVAVSLSETIKQNETNVLQLSRSEWAVFTNLFRLETE